MKMTLLSQRSKSTCSRSWGNIKYIIMIFSSLSLFDFNDHKMQLIWGFTSTTNEGSLTMLSARRNNNDYNNNVHNKNKVMKRTQHGKLAPMEYEKSIHARGYNYVIGADEVGRGSIAGPVFAVSCCILNHPSQDQNNNDDTTTNHDSFRPIDLVTDSKELTSQERQLIYDQIIHNDENQKYYKYSVSQRSSNEIEKSNILKATMDCFQESIENLILTENFPLDQTYAIVDGKSTPKLVNGPTPIPCRPYVSADKFVYTVSIASILAKVIRDNFMIEASKLYPEYGFDINKGYSSREHIEAIHKYGPCPLHRMSFKPLQNRK